MSIYPLSLHDALPISRFAPLLIVAPSIVLLVPTVVWMVPPVSVESVPPLMVADERFTKAPAPDALIVPPVLAIALLWMVKIGRAHVSTAVADVPRLPS